MRCPRCHSDNADTSRFCAECGSALRGRVPGSAADAQRGPPPKTSEEPGARGGQAPSSSGAGTRLHDFEGLPTKTIVTPIKPVSAGEFLAGKYRVIDELGRGGMGVVVRAEDTRLKRTVALKFLSQEFTGDPEARERFILEARAASALEHPNICNIHEIDEAPDGRMFMAMACYEGESLRERLRRGKLEYAEALSIALQTARGLAKAHEKGIVHRDIKPGNVFLTDDGQAKILDFGLAKLAADLRLTRTGATLGTVAYMSPEQAQGKPVDARTDVWSLGVMLYEMLTGELPFGGETEGSLVHSIIYRPARALRKADPAIPAEIERVVLLALEKNPEDRYKSMADFLSDLEALSEGLKPAKAKGGLLRGRILGIRKPVFLAASASILIVAVLGLLALLSGPGRADVFDSVAILPIVNETGDTSKDYFANSLTRQLNAELYKVAALTVPPAESIMTFKGSDKPPKKIAQELGVKAVVQVSWLQVGSKHRLIYTLSDPFRNKVIAADTLEREGEDILYLQSEFARAVVGAVKVAVSPAEQTLLASARKVNPEAYDLVMQGIDYFLNAPITLDMPMTSWYSTWIDYFQRAIEIDPTLALAHAWKGFIYETIALNQYADPEPAYKKAKEAALKALELDEELATAHLVLAEVKFYRDWDFAGSEVEYKKALGLEAGNELLYLGYGRFLAYTGRYDESIGLYKSRMREDEKTQAKRLYSQGLVDFYTCAGRYDEALEEAINLVNSEPGHNWFNILWLACTYALKGMYPEALSRLEEIRIHPGPRENLFVLANYAWILALSGRREEALSELEKLEVLLAQRRISPAYFAAAVYGGLGDKDKAFEYLYQAYERRWPFLVLLKSDGWFHSLHGDPRFEELVRKIGFPVVPGPK